MYLSVLYFFWGRSFYFVCVIWVVGSVLRKSGMGFFRGSFMSFNKFFFFEGKKEKEKEEEEER